MGNSVIPFQMQAGMPALFQELFGGGLSDDLSANVGMGYSYLSIQGKNFHIVSGQDSELQMTPGSNMPAQYLDIVLLKASRNMAKTFYLNGFTQESHAPPDCMSNDGIVPDPSSPQKQAPNCAGCPQNQWGTRMGADGEGKGKACQDNRRVAIATIDFIEDPMLLRVPPTTLKAMAEYGNTLAKKGVPYQAVVTRIFFDHTVAYPKLNFQAVRFVTDAEAVAIKLALEDAVVEQIVGGTLVQQPPQQPPAAAAAQPVTPPPTQPTPPANNQYVPTGGMFADAAPAQPAAQPQTPPPAAAPAETPKRRRKAATTQQAPAAASGPIPNGAAHAGVTVVAGEVAQGLDAMLSGLPDVPNI